MTTHRAHPPAPDDEVVRLCPELIRIDSHQLRRRQRAGGARGRGVRRGPAARGRAGGRRWWRATRAAPASCVRVEGEDRDRPALCIHGHLDVVPANAADWQVDPFAAEERDGCIWGRGAVDMKDMDAMILANIRDLARTGTKPPRDIVVRLLRRRGGRRRQGQPLRRRPPPGAVRRGHRGRSARWAATASPCRRRQGETRAYLVQTAEKGILWLRCTPTGGPATARCPTTRTPSCGSPRRSAASTRTSGRASTSPRCASCSTG